MSGQQKLPKFIVIFKLELLGSMILTKLKLVLVGALLLAFSAQARVINVPGDFRKIGDALGNADAGDTIKVRRGVYNENITLIMGVVLKGEDPRTTIIDGGRRGPTVNGTSGGEISHFTIRNGIEGVLCENAAPYIHHNWIIDNHATGLAAFISLPNVRNNIIYGNRWSGFLAWGAKSLDSRVEQNVIMRNGFYGVSLKGPTNIIVRNNIIMENHNYGIWADPAAGQTKAEFNNIYKNYYPFNRFIKINRTNLNTDPKFINPTWSKPNFFISSRSPLVKRGKGRLNIGLLERDEVLKVDGDTDKDGIPDGEDACPNDPEDEDDFEDDDGCPEPDNDQDGVNDGLDKCPTDKEDRDGFEDTDGCPETDNDGDNILDEDDRCPDDAETVNGFKDQDGCPDEEPKKPKKKFILKGINFVSGKADLTPDSKVALMKVLDQLEAFPKSKFKVVGYTDSRGPARANKKLSKDRAASVRKWLIDNGIDGKRLRAQGKGEARPIASNKTAAGRAKNRRIEFYRTR
jgi:outer membrane protein OmpA-like peptidoglycan-associated protein